MGIMDKPAAEIIGMRDAQLKQLADTLAQVHAFNRTALPQLQEVLVTQAQKGYQATQQTLQPKLSLLCQSLQAIYAQIDGYEAEMDRAEAAIAQAEKDLAAVQEFKAVSVLGRIKGLWGRLRG